METSSSWLLTHFIVSKSPADEKQDKVDKNSTRAVVRELRSVQIEMPTIIIKVDLDCGRCHAKIRKVLERIREKGEFIIDDIKYDEKKNHVIVSGPFDADKLGDKLCCKACNIIKEIETVEPIKKQEPKPPPPTDKVKPPGPGKDETVKEKEKPPPPPPPPAKVVQVPVPVPYPCPYPYPFPAGPSGCCCHQGHGGCQCSTPAPQYTMPPSYPCGGYMMVCEEDPSGACTVM
ncbi:protein PYRICULARIA ORYZAE RESISTANCE 21 isoform X1 [Triticum aestivum]|nr:protein PYRICULARIA ORYZAE RESISTANCE 21-like isoform X1 [Triticum aestivum]